MWPKLIKSLNDIAAVLCSGHTLKRKFEEMLRNNALYGDVLKNYHKCPSQTCSAHL